MSCSGHSNRRSFIWGAVPLVGVLMMGAPARGSEDSAAVARLRALFASDWQFRLEDDPVFATLLGDDRYADRWRDLSAGAFERRATHDREVLDALDVIDLESLPDSDRLDAEIFRRTIEDDVTERRFRGHLLALNHMEGIQSLTQEIVSFPFQDVPDYERWIARLRAFPVLMDQTVALLREGIRAGILQPRVIIERVPAQIAAQRVENPAESGFFEPFRRMPAGIDEAARERLRQEGLALIAHDVLPSYARLADFIEKEYLPACPPAIGAAARPDGAAWYAALARRFTTTDLSPDRIHEIGLKEVDRIRAAMIDTMREASFEGTFAEFLDFLRTDPRFYHPDGESLLHAYRALTRRIDPALVRLFRTFPRMPYGVEPIPDDIAPDTTTAYYREPAADGTRAGTYFVNLYRPEVRPIYEMEALSLHESVPGHHFQIALAMELEGLPAFRRYSGFTAFVEGWALYAESLGPEIGFYRDPYSRFGQLTYQMWRAVRLVVDTGMHAKGWTRDRAIAYFRTNAAKSEHDIVNEIDRYIAWPGQALAYKIGELRIKELRARAESALGGRFDVRAFHDVVLLGGAVPLDILEERVSAWIARASRSDQAGAN